MRRWLSFLKGVIRRMAGVETKSTAVLYKGLHIGAGTSCLEESLDGVAPQLITIGENCIVAPTAMILVHDASLFVHTGKYRVEPVTIGNRVFIGYGAIILPGVTIGDGAVIGAGAVVTHDVPPATVVAGVPAEILGSVGEMVARNSSTLVEPPYPVGHTPSVEEVLAFQRIILAKMGRSAES